MIYLDHAASSPVRREVLEAMWPALTGAWGNPSSRHEPGEAARAMLLHARDRVAEHLNARPAEITFTSGGTESSNAAVKGIALAALSAGKRHVLVSALEHPSVTESAHWLQRFGVEVEILPVDEDGAVRPEVLAEHLREDTALVSVQYASNEVGTVQDIAALAEVASAHGVPLHTDAVQAAGTLSLDTRALGISSLSLSGHKLGTPKGVGVLFLRHGTASEPLLHGGGQQRGRRSGTEDVAGAAALAAALDLTTAQDMPGLRRRTEEFISAVEEAAAAAGQQVRLIGARTTRLPGHAAFVFAGRSGESVLLDLQRRGVVCSSGSACDASDPEPSPALLAMGLSPHLAETMVRFSFTAATTAEELRSAAATVGEVLSSQPAGRDPQPVEEMWVK